MNWLKLIGIIVLIMGLYLVIMMIKNGKGLEVITVSLILGIIFIIGSFAAWVKRTQLN